MATEKEQRKQEAEENRREKFKRKELQRQHQRQKDLAKQEKQEKELRQKHGKLWFRIRDKKRKIFGRINTFFYFIIKIITAMYSFAIEHLSHWAMRYKICPYVPDFLFALFNIGVFALSVTCFFALILIIFAQNFVLAGKTILYGTLGIYLLAFSIELLFIRVIPLFFLDFITGKRTRRRKVELRRLRWDLTNPLIEFDPVASGGGSLLSYGSFLCVIFGRKALPCRWYFKKIKKNHTAKTSQMKLSPNFYARANKKPPKYRALRFVRLVITKSKSKHIDKLYQVEPTGEFEITYLFFSRILKEIHPIPVWDYAEGVEEICDRINALYP